MSSLITISHEKITINRTIHPTNQPVFTTLWRGERGAGRPPGRLPGPHPGHGDAHRMRL